MNQKPKQNYTFALIVVFIVLFLIGFITTMNNSMIDFCKQAFGLTEQQGQYVNTAFYGAYLLSIPFAFLMNKIGYKGTLILGLAVAGIGFVINSFGIDSAISAGSNVYTVFLSCMCLVAMGVVMLQNVANPYVMVLGSPEGGAFRMTPARVPARSGSKAGRRSSGTAPFREENAESHVGRGRSSMDKPPPI